MLVLTILLAAMALVTLGVVLGQFLLQRTTAGGRGLLLSKGRLGIQTVHENTGKKTHAYRVEVNVAGPGVWHEVVVHLESDGYEFDTGGDRPEARRSMDCESEPIIWNLDLTQQVADELWCVVTWAAPRGPALRTEAIASPLGGGPTYRWRWVVGYRHRGLLSQFASRHGPAWFRDRFRRARPLGRWKRYPPEPLREGTGPLDLGRPPGPRRWPRAIFWSCW